MSQECAFDDGDDEGLFVGFEQTAKLMGARKAGEPVIMRVDSAAAAEAGVAFYVGNEKVWLADLVPPSFVPGERG